MAVGPTYQANFTFGRISDDLYGRVDVGVYAAALGDALNLIPTPQGPLPRRPGFMLAGLPKLSVSKSRGVPFKRSATDQVWLEFGHLYVRFWQMNGAPLLLFGVPYEIASPFTADQLAGLRWDQSNDVLFIVHIDRDVEPRALQRRGVVDWAFVTVKSKDGPWRRENGDRGSTISASAYKGTGVALTATNPVFDIGQVGGLFRFRQPDGAVGVRSWAPTVDNTDDGPGGDANAVQPNELQLSDGKVYRCASVDTGDVTGNTPPIHESGTVSDGKVDWEYIHDGAGVVRITAVADAYHATCDVLANLPTTGDGAGANGVRTLGSAANPAFPATSYWSEGAWSNLRGWPGDVKVMDEERIAFSGPAAEPGRYHLTRSFGFGPDWLDFKPGLGTGRVLDDDAINQSVKGGADPIAWLGLASFLFVGTAARESAVTGETLDGALTPDGVKTRRLTDNGSADVRPEAALGGVIYVTRDGRGVFHLSLGAGDQKQLGNDELSYFVSDLVRDGVKGLAWAGRPNGVLWAWTTNGNLLSLAYDPNQKVMGWSRHTIGDPQTGGFDVEDVSVMAGDDGRDVVWLIVRRTKGNADQRLILRLADRWRDGDSVLAICYLDACELYSGAAVGTIGGLDHLEGEAVIVMGDGGRVVQNLTVTGGEVTLRDGATVALAWIGLDYPSIARTLPLDLSGPAGAVGMSQTVTAATVFLADAAEAKLTFAGGPPEVVKSRAWGDTRRPGRITQKADLGGHDAREAYVTVKMDGPWPGTLQAIRAHIAATE